MNVLLAKPENNLFVFMRQDLNIIYGILLFSVYEKEKLTMINV
jgi:hypothetical protein